MVQLYSLTLACLVGFAQNTELFSSDCCAKKNVGGVAYTQVPGDTTDFQNCKAGCVYERDTEPGSRYCFSTGDITTDMPVMCTEPTSTTHEVFVTRENGQLSFESPDVSLSCNMEYDIETKEINCTAKIGSERHGAETAGTVGPAGTAKTAETATLISSFLSNGALEWISLHAKYEWYHCTFLSVTSCSILPSSMSEKNMLYVEDAFQIQNQLGDLTAQLAECKQSCATNSACQFWTFSYLQDTGRQFRAHDNKSECGLRSYDACCLIETNRDQWFGTVGFAGIQISNRVAVWKVYRSISNKQCYENCKTTPGCTTWTWDFDKNTCSLNNYKPTRKIPIGYVNNPTPNLVSGCIAGRGFKCTEVPVSGPPAPTPSPRQCPEMNTDFFGNDLGILRNIPSWQDCVCKCKTTEGCNAITWTPKDIFKNTPYTRCLLKSSNSGQMPFQRAISASIECWDTC